MSEILFLEGKLVNLRPYDPEADLDLFTKWFNDPQVQQFMSMGLFPVTRAIEEEKARQLSENETSVFLVVETKEGTTIGTVGLHRIHWINRTAVTGACIGNSKFWGNGYGTDAKMLLLHHGFTRLNLRQIKASVLSYNKRSYRALLKQGYEEIGRLPNWHFKNGRYHDEVIMVLTKTKFLKIWRDYNS